MGHLRLLLKRSKQLIRALQTVLRDLCKFLLQLRGLCLNDALTSQFGQQIFIFQAIRYVCEFLGADGIRTLLLLSTKHRILLLSIDSIILSLFEEKYVMLSIIFLHLCGILKSIAPIRTIVLLMTNGGNKSMRNKLIALTLVLAVIIGGTLYTDRTLYPDKAAWQPSPAFAMFNTTLRGYPEQIGVTATTLEAGVASQMMWYFWNQPQVLFGKPFQITAVNRRAAKEHLLYEGSIGMPGRMMGGSLRVARAMSTVTLPTKGLWRLDAKVDGKQIGSVVVEVF
jgi:hypothetical protein